MLAVDLKSMFLATRAAVPAMAARGAGSVVCVSSVAALRGHGRTAYAAAKAGVIMYTRHLAREVGGYGIRANCVAPGTTLSDRVESIMDSEAIEQTAALSPLNRIGLPKDTANATLFLLSEAASFLTGVTLDVSGGRVML